MKIRYRIFNLIVAVLLIAIVIGNVFAWFSAKDAELEITGASAGAYFAYGDGTKDKDGDGQIHGPYGITTPTHLFNLAWLQNTGKIVPGTYFELGADITIEKGYVLPPIGNATNPFNSVFNGNGHTIDGLIVSTNKNVLHGNPADADYKFSNAVGMFGMTETKSEIKNFILADPTVEVSNVNTTYSAITSADPAAVGLAIGYVNGKASSIGVKGGKYSVLREMSGDDKYKTYNSILGDMSDTAKQNNSITGGDSSSSGNGDTGIFYPDDIYSKIYNDHSSDAYINFTTSSTKAGDLYFKNNIWINSANNNYLGLGSLSFTTSGGSDEEARLRNDHAMTKIYYFNTIDPNEALKNASQIEYFGSPDMTIDLSTTSTDTTVNSIKSKIVDTSNAELKKLTFRFMTANKITDMSEQTVTVYNEDGTTEDSGKFNIFSRSIKVNVVSNNAKVFVIAASNSNTQYDRKLGIYKVDDTNGIPSYLQPSNFKITNEADKTSVYKEQINQPYQSILLNGSGKNNGDALTPIAVEFDLSTVKIGDKTYGGPGAYVIGSADQSIGIYYAKITGMEGGNADTGELGEGLSAIDFIYDDVTINQEEVSYTDGDNGTKTLAPGNFIYANKLYTASQVRIYYDSISATLYISFARTSTSFDVTYNNEAEPQTSGSGSVKFKYASAFTFTVP